MANQQKNTQASELIDIARRAAVKKIAVLFAGVLSARSLSAAMAKQTGASNPHQQTLAFKPEELQLVKVIAELIIPETDTPGAIAADVHGFMDHQVANCFTENERNQFLYRLSQINSAAKQRYKKIFTGCTNQQQTKMLQNMEHSNDGFSETDKTFFKQFKALTLLGYYTSEIGATQELAYLAVPGGYIGDYPFGKVGKAWAL